MHLPSALYDAHPLWRTPKFWTVIDIEALQAPAPTTIRPAAVDSLTAPRVVTLGQIPAVVVRSATALRARPQTAVHFAWSSSDPQGVEHTDWSCGDGRRTSRRCRRAAAPGPVGQPGAVLFEQGVGLQEELAHDGGQSDLRRLPLAAELAVLRTQVRVATERRQGRHVEKPPHPRPAALDEAAALPGARLARDRRVTGQAGDRLGVEATE